MNQLLPNKLAQLFVGLIFLVCAPAWAANSPTGASFPDWLKVSLAKKTFLSEIYENSIAESIIIRMNGKGFFPPVQYFVRPATEKLLPESLHLGREILMSLGVNLKSESTIRLRDGEFKAGDNGEYNGYFAEYNSINNNETVVTCMIFVQDGNKIHTAFTSAFRTSLANCSEELVKLARSPYLFQ